MLSNPTAADLIESVKISLMKDILPEVQSDRARVLLMMMQTLLTSVQRRVPLEQQYMADECNRMQRLLREVGEAFAGAEGEEASRLRALADAASATPETPPLLLFAELNGRYRALSEAFTAALEPLNALDSAGDETARALLNRFRAYINLRCMRDMEAHFAMDAGLVGRG